MNEIYQIVGDCRQTFVEMSYTYSQDINEIEETVGELMLYFMQMNPDTLRSIFEKDGKKGIISYGAVVLRRSFTSPRSPYYYKYKKYYTHIDSRSSNITYDNSDVYHKKHLYNIDNFYWYDRDVFKLYYYEGNTLTGLAKKTGISRNSLFTTIDKVREQLKDLLDE